MTLFFNGGRHFTRYNRVCRVCKDCVFVACPGLNVLPHLNEGLRFAALSCLAVMPSCGSNVPIKDQKKTSIAGTRSAWLFDYDGAHVANLPVGD